MTPTETLELKRQSRDKWRAIVADLEKDNPRWEWRFRCEDCGYCQAFEVQVPCVKCNACALVSMSLCGKGRGLAYTAVVAFAPWLRGIRGSTLWQARVMLAAIEADVAKDEAELAK